MPYFCTPKLILGKIGLWCKGSTTDFDSVCLGSNPSNPTKKPVPAEPVFLLDIVYIPLFDHFGNDFTHATIWHLYL